MTQILWIEEASANDSIVTQLVHGKIQVTCVEGDVLEPPRQHLITERLFEDGDLRGWLKADGTWPAVVESPTREGRYAMRSYINRETTPEPWRCEVQLAENPELPAGMGPHWRFVWGEDYWIGLSIYIPADFVIEVPNWGDTLFQVHLKPDKGERWRQPIFNIHIDGDDWTFARRWDTRAYTPPDEGAGSWTGQAQYRTPLGDSIGRWTDFVIHARWTWLDDGFLQVWKDGNLVVDVKGPCGANDKFGPHIAMGLYKWPWRDTDNPSNATERTFYHDSLRIGDSHAGYEDVAP